MSEDSEPGPVVRTLLWHDSSSSITVTFVTSKEDFLAATHTPEAGTKPICLVPNYKILKDGWRFRTSHALLSATYDDFDSGFRLIDDWQSALRDTPTLDGATLEDTLLNLYRQTLAKHRTDTSQYDAHMVVQPGSPLLSGPQGTA